MGRYDALKDYLAARKGGGWGWKSEYEKSVCGDKEDWAFLAGHYSALLEDLLRFCPEAIIELIEQIEQQEGECMNVSEAKKKEIANAGRQSGKTVSVHKITKKTI